MGASWSDLRRPILEAIPRPPRDPDPMRDQSGEIPRVNGQRGSTWPTSIQSPSSMASRYARLPTGANFMDSSEMDSRADPRLLKNHMEWQRSSISSRGQGVGIHSFAASSSLTPRTLESGQIWAGPERRLPSTFVRTPAVILSRSPEYRPSGAKRDIAKRSLRPLLANASVIMRNRGFRTVLADPNGNRSTLWALQRRFRFDRPLR